MCFYQISKKFYIFYLGNDIFLYKTTNQEISEQFQVHKGGSVLVMRTGCIV